VPFEGTECGLVADHRNFASASVVSFGRSSSTQCPVSFKTTLVTFEATSFICCASTSPIDFSPEIDRTGNVRRPGELSEILRGLLEGDEVGPGGAHARERSVPAAPLVLRIINSPY
jgi:hypothetical protein